MRTVTQFQTVTMLGLDDSRAIGASRRLSTMSILITTPERPAMRKSGNFLIYYRIGDIHVSQLSREDDEALGRALESARCD
jgi:hypothetical protein